MFLGNSTSGFYMRYCCYYELHERDTLREPSSNKLLPVGHCINRAYRALNYFSDPKHREFRSKYKKEVIPKV